MRRRRKMKKKSPKKDKKERRRSETFKVTQLKHDEEPETKKDKKPRRLSASFTPEKTPSAELKVDDFKERKEHKKRA